MQPRVLAPNEMSNRIERLGASLAGMLIDYTFGGVRSAAVFRERAEVVLSMLNDIEHAYSPAQLPILGTLTRCANYFEGWSRYDDGAVFFRGGRYHKGDVTKTLNKSKHYAWEDDFHTTVSMQPGQDFLDERVQRFAVANGLELGRFGRVSVMRSKEAGGDKIILARWAGKEPRGYHHLVAGLVEASGSGSYALTDELRLVNELTCALDVSEVNLATVFKSDLR